MGNSKDSDNDKCKIDVKTNPLSGCSQKRILKHDERFDYRVTLTLNDKKTDRKHTKTASGNEKEQATHISPDDKRGRKKHNFDELAQRTQNTILKLIQKIKNTTDQKERKRLSNLISAY